MTSPNAVPIVNLGELYINNLQVSRTSNTVLSIAAGQCRDSTNVFDIVVSSALTLNAANSGANGIDTGSFAASKMYAIHVIFDPSYNYSPACLLSLSATAPTLPYGYSVFRCIGYWGTDGSTHFYVGDYVGNQNKRVFYYDAILASPVTAGAATSFTAVDLSNLVPAVDNLEVDFYMALTPNSAGNAAAFRPTGSSSTNGQHILTGNVAAKISDQKVKLLSKLASGAPKIDYKVSNGSDALAISIEGFSVNL